MFEKLKRRTAANRLVEERLYEQALNEAQSGRLRDGLWAKALANSLGDEIKARALYLKYRVQSMLDESELLKGVEEELDKLSSEMENAEKNSLLAEENSVHFDSPDAEKVMLKFELSKMKSAIMRDQVEYIQQVVSSSGTNEIMPHLRELISLADLFESTQSKQYLSQLNNDKGS